MRKLVPVLCLGLALAGCASSSAEITPAYVSPFIYQNPCRASSYADAITVIGHGAA
jgi:hypothetical protein